MNSFTTDSTIAEIVTSQPSAAALFDQLDIDFCCGGDIALSEAARGRDLDAQTLLATLDALDAIQGDTAGAHDVKDLSTDDLIEHIVRDHHEGTRKQIPMITELLDTVVRVHSDDPTLAPLRERFVSLADELTEHMRVEEEDLFPVCRAIEAGEGASIEPALIDDLTHEHTAVGEGLVAMRELGGGYDQEAAHCNTHRFLLKSLSEFDEDLRVHIHEENNVLFPRARTALAAASAK